MLRYNEKRLGWTRQLILTIPFLIFSAAVCIAQTAPGKIAYFKGGRELHIINPDGGNDHIIWTNPVNSKLYLSSHLAWRPDGKELAFSSKHEQLRSVYISDIYAIKPDGSGLRRVTNSPQVSELAAFSRGNVEIEIENYINDWATFFVYVSGADSSQLITLQPGWKGTFTVPGVADFGAGVRQGVVVYDASHNWHFVGIPVDVVAGQTIKHPGVLQLSNNHVTAMQATTPAWNRSGTQIAFDLSGGVAEVIAANPPLLALGDAIFPSGSNIFVRYLAWSPVADEIVFGERYSANGAISRAAPGASQTTPLVNIGNDLVEGISWLPDGSGFVFGVLDALEQYAHLYLYTFSTGNTTQLTNFTNELAVRPSVSPDGQYVCYTKYIKATSAFEVHVLKLDGSNTWRITADGDFSAWGVEAGSPPPPPPPGQSGISNLDFQNNQQTYINTPNNAFVFGTNEYFDIAKGTVLSLPGGINQAQISDVKVWFAYKKSGLSSGSYKIEIYNGNAQSGPAGSPIYSQDFNYSAISADDDPNTIESATVHTFTTPVTVGPNFFVVVNFGNYDQANYDAISIACTGNMGQRIAEEWELWQDGTWHNVSDVWYGDSSPNSGTDGWRMWIEAVTTGTTDVEGKSLTETIPTEFELKQNYPNPFNPVTTIEYNLPTAGFVSLKIFNLAGAVVNTLVAERQPAGLHKITFIGSKLASGIYYYRIEAGDHTALKKLLFLK